MEVCFNLCYMHVVLGVDLSGIFKFDTSYMSTWSLQWAMLHRDFHLTSMSGIADISDKHPNGPGLIKKTRLETACKYYSLISKMQVAENIQCIEGKRTHETWVNMSCKCMYCGEAISKTKHWRTPVNEDIHKVRKDNERCKKLLDQWKSLFPANYKNANLKIFRKGEGLTQKFLKKPRTGELGPGHFGRHPDLHPTAYQRTDPNDIRLMLSVRGLLPTGYGIIHPNLRLRKLCHWQMRACGYQSLAECCRTRAPTLEPCAITFSNVGKVWQ